VEVFWAIHGIAWVREFVAVISPVWKNPGKHLCFVFVITDNTGGEEEEEENQFWPFHKFLVL